MSKVIVALDFDEQAKALNLVEQLDPKLCKLKVGKEMFTYFGPDFVKKLVGRGFDIFLDLKFHDIPNTVAKACVAAADLGVWMINVHASGGKAMMLAANDALNKLSERPMLIAVTVLTSMGEGELPLIGVNKLPGQQVMDLASLTYECGLDGVVCSAEEATILKQKFGHKFALVTPGIRPVGAASNDQTRIVTPEQAVQNGADYLVIGRPITQSNNPLAVIQQINSAIS